MYTEEYIILGIAGAVMLNIIVQYIRERLWLCKLVAETHERVLFKRMSSIVALKLVCILQLWLGLIAVGILVQCAYMAFL